MNRTTSGGFTLIELLVVVALILTMYVMAYGPAQKSFQEKQLIVCQKNLLMIQIALKIYASDYHDSYPVVPGALSSETPLSLLVPRDTTETAIFICPGSARRRLPEAEPFTHRKISYAYYMGRTLQDGSEAALASDAQVDAAPKTPGQTVFSPDGKKPGNNHYQYGGNFLFCDGSVQYTPSRLAFTLPPATNVVLLNPKP